VEVLNAVLEELSQSDVRVVDTEALPARTLVALSELCALPEPQSGMSIRARVLGAFVAFDAWLINFAVLRSCIGVQLAQRACQQLCAV
jgi:hypothetical protein